MAQVQIRPYLAEDWPRLCAIHDAARLDELRLSAGEDSFLTLEQTAENEGLFAGEVAVALVDGEVQGFVAYRPDELSWLYVSPAAYRRGVGRALVRHVLSASRQPLTVEVLEGNEPALSLYLSEGFTVERRIAGRLEGNEAFPAVGLVLRHPGRSGDEPDAAILP
ncbi:N-acetyltransferase family protein [[Pseudomonas] boreopolis]|uniref:GNAT family N-acetyltransferase n=1 Tax=Xanthomonas boreopolis TaxID=86183 RepID=UPI003D3C942D